MAAVCLWRETALVRSHVEHKCLEQKSYRDADLASLGCTYDGLTCVMEIAFTGLP